MVNNKEFIRFDKNVTFVVLQETGDVIEKLRVSEKEARGWIREHGWIPLDVSKTEADETVIWVA